MARRQLARGKELNKHTRELATLKVGDTVSVQNQNQQEQEVPPAGPVLQGDHQQAGTSGRSTSGRQDSATADPGRAQEVSKGRQEEPGSDHRPPSLSTVGAKF